MVDVGLSPLDKVLVDEVVSAGRKVLNKKPLTKDNIIWLVGALYLVTKKMTVTGSMKKRILLEGMLLLIDAQQDIGDVEKELLKEMVTDIVGQVVEAVHQAVGAGNDGCLIRCCLCLLGGKNKQAKC